MENYVLDNDIEVFYVPATSFPDGVMAAHQQLHSLVPFTKTRNYFGLSRPNEHGVIEYKAATESTFDGEGGQYGCPSFTIVHGNYVCIDIHDYMQNIPAIGEAFRQLTAHEDIDPNGMCVEWYLSQTDVKCMVRLK